MRQFICALCGLLALLFAGCTTLPQKGQPQPPNWQAVPPPSPAPAVHTNAPPPAAVKTAPPAAPFVDTWLPLDDWGRQHGAPPPHRLSGFSIPTYSVATTNGVLVVQAWSRSAYWDGVEIFLGFAPELVASRVYLHRVDLVKTLDPLTASLAGLDRTNRVIVIDPGHGGGNTGTSSIIDHHFEKEFTLDWAQRLAPLLEQRGWRVLLTRTNDEELTLPDRVAFADENKADLFISLHFNSLAPNEEPAGVETYYLTPAGMPSTLTREYPDNPAQVYPNNAFDEQNAQLAMRLQRAIVAANGHVDRGVCKARFMGVLRGQRRPAVLIEGGFLSNPTEARRIEDPAFRQKLAEAVANALTETNLIHDAASLSHAPAVTETNFTRTATNLPHTTSQP